MKTTQSLHLIRICRMSLQWILQYSCIISIFVLQSHLYKTLNLSHVQLMTECKSYVKRPIITIFPIGQCCKKVLFTCNRYTLKNPKALLAWIYKKDFTNVVYFDQLLGAARTQKLVETFFQPFSTFFDHFKPFPVISRLKSTKNV